MSAAVILAKELKELSKNPTYHITLQDDSIFSWKLGFYIINPESPWNHAYLTANIEFKKNYPFAPPSFTFSPPIFHANVYNDGKVCISILHESVTTPMSGEPDNETWSPAQCVESVIISIISILDDPNIYSPANTDASNMWRDRRDEYNEKIKKFAETSRQSIPSDFQIPSDESIIKGSNNHIDEDNWYFDEEDEDDDDEEEEDDDLDQMSYEESEAEMSEDYEDNENETTKITN
ncbi:hypothetical protein DAPK24_043860 [Pichia kluyveri]|uniref:UBC core domain-containing protein n=1 Tax=Pichia kluyveri TaxID=36015 RepID=A0AAV5RAG7_PICKL|nr:hypothetical protein DAPK24_043860 [Pichia kluyveri]